MVGVFEASLGLTSLSYENNGAEGRGAVRLGDAKDACRSRRSNLMNGYSTPKGFTYQRWLKRIKRGKNVGDGTFFC